MDDDLIGTTLGAYEVRERLGSGGMATVYKGFQTSMERDVAIKVLPRQMALDPTFMGRFAQEAKTIAKLEHARILPVYDYGQQGGIAYLVMRYLPGGTLADRLAHDPPNLPETVRIISQVAEALDYAHGRGIIHRDVKPSNIMLDDSGDATLTDFGISKLMEGSVAFTGSGIVGTPAYLAPEQGMGQPVDARTDVYSLGVVLYEMAVGALPYEADTPMAMVIKHINEPLPAPRSFDESVPPAVEAVIMRALSKDPTLRYQSCGALTKALEKAAAGEPVAPPPKPEMSTITLPERETSQPEPTVAMQPPPGDAPAPPITPAPPKRRDGLPLAAVVGGAVGGALLIGLVLLAVFLMGRGRLVASADPTPPATNEPPPPTNEPPPAGGGRPQPGVLGSPVCSPPDLALDTTFDEPLPPDLLATSLNAEVVDGVLVLQPAAEEGAAVGLDVTESDTIVTVNINLTEGDFFLMGSRTADDPATNGFIAAFNADANTVALLRAGEVLVEPQPLPASTAAGPDTIQMRTVGPVVEVLFNGQRVLRFFDDLDLNDGGLLLAAEGAAVEVLYLDVCAVQPRMTSHNTLVDVGFDGPGTLTITDLLGTQREAWQLRDGRLVATIPPESDIAASPRGAGINAPALAFANLPPTEATILTVTVQVGISPTENYQSAGLMALTDEGRPLFLFGRGYCDPTEGGCYGDSVYIQPVGQVIEARTVERVGVPDADLPEGQPILLRLIIGEAEIIAQYSTDGGQSWPQLEAFEGLVAGRISGVGVYGSAGGEQTKPIVAFFDGFQVAEGDPMEAVRR